MKALMVGAGEDPGVRLLRERAGQTDFIIAVDGGLQFLHHAGILPDLIVGDLDSADQRLVDEYPPSAYRYLNANTEKDETDSMLALDQLIADGFKTIFFLGATGKRIDHLLSNFMLLKRAFSADAELIIEDKTQIVRLCIGDFTVRGKVGQTVSIIPFEEYATVSAAGFYYPLHSLRLTNDVPRGVSNILTKETASGYSDRFIYVILDK